MKVTLLAENLKTHLSFVNHAISSRSDLPVLMHLLIEARDGQLILKSTDLEIGIQVTIPAEIEEEGGVTVPAKTFTELISSLAQEKVTLETQEGSLKVISRRTRSAFQTISKEEFPKLFEEKGELAATLTIDELKKDMSMVVFSSSSDTARPALSGILMKREKNGFLFVATDGYRLSLKHHGASLGSANEDQELIVPARVLREVISMKEEGSNIEVYIAKSSNQVLFEMGNTLLVGRLIEAQFPQYEKIIPTDHASQSAFEREEMLKAVKICSIFAREAANIIKLSLRKEKIIVSSQTPSLGENTVEIEANLTGEENEIAFNARYLLDVLSNLSDDVLTLEMTGPLNPGVFKVKDNASFLHLIMPIRVQQ